VELGSRGNRVQAVVDHIYETSEEEVARPPLRFVFCLTGCYRDPLRMFIFVPSLLGPLSFEDEAGTELKSRLKIKASNNIEQPRKYWKWVHCNKDV
jgi:hypothetical protein